MESINNRLIFSAGDIVGHLQCHYLTGLDLDLISGKASKPETWDPLLEILRERGARHEQGYIEHLLASGFPVTVIDGVGIGAGLVGQTLDAMRAGADIIVQAAFEFDGWSGRTDILRKIEKPSRTLGAWSYEVIDTKLARETKGGTLLQLCLYSELVAQAQGETPEWMYVVAPLTEYEPQKFRTADFAAYYRRVKESLGRAATEGIGDGTYPNPIEHCEICRWRLHCERKRRADDHLCLVAGIGKGQIDELQRRAIGTMAALAIVPLPIPWKPERGAVQTYTRVREQARVQVEAREAGRLKYETLPVEPGLGLCLLPEPSPGDVFFDLEGDPFVGEHGLEYLFGYGFLNEDGSKTYIANWALSRDDEKAAFQRFVDFVIDRLARYPDLHIYHYAPYEPGALKRLMGRYATREDEIDRMLRSKLLVDLYAVVRHAIRASVESYSIKRLEPLYGFTRETELPDANLALTRLQSRLELGDLEAIDQTIRAVVEAYNRDDCISTWQLRDWLEGIRAELIARGDLIDRPPVVTGDPGDALNNWQQRIAALSECIAGDVPPDVEERTPEQQARWLLANILDWHRREQKAIWWEHYRLADLGAEDLLDERAGLAGLRFLGTTGGTAKAPVHRYAFAQQETELRGDEDLRLVGGRKFGKLHRISLEERWIDVKKRQDTAATHPEAIFANKKVIGAQVLAEALVRIGEHVAEHGIIGEGPYRAARNLLLREPPHVGGELIHYPDETPLDAALRIAPRLDGAVLPMQGPPGAGKTYTGARMICALVNAGCTVGITANSHKVIRNLLEEVLKAADELDVDLRCLQKVSEPEKEHGRLSFEKSNERVLASIAPGGPVVGGVAWLWARPDASQKVDVLFVDEAAQMSLANVLAVSQAARSVVLLGDPRQLEQPIQGSHPDGTDVSALDHILLDPVRGDSFLTVPKDRGLFLEETWRLHPDICAFTSELFYESRLRSREGLEVQEVRSSSRVSGCGLRYLPVSHHGNRNFSPEEAEAVRGLVQEILKHGSTWIDRNGREQPITLADILIVAPYNAQVFELQNRLRLPGARIGTVDKFQGQEAPIVICSMTTSSHADAPRGMEFLYSLNRLNVATSRAKCVCILVASPTLFEAVCRTPRQMQLANAFCRYLELATEI